MKISMIYKSINVLWASVWFSVKERYMGSVLGLMWLILLPVLFTSLYSSVYAIYLGNTETAPSQIIMVLCGLIPFLSFAESYGVGVNSIVSNAALIKNTMFPIQLVPLKDVMVGHISMAAAYVMLLAGGEYYIGLNLNALYVIPLAILQILFITGVVYIASTINVFVRDISKSTPVVMLLLMLVTPIAIEVSNVPESYKFIFEYNPLSLFVELYREIIVKGLVNIEQFGKVCIISILTFLTGFWLVSRLRGVFVDYV